MKIIVIREIITQISDTSVNSSAKFTHEPIWNYLPKKMIIVVIKKSSLRN
jgi:hypothetical protein